VKENEKIQKPGEILVNRTGVLASIVVSDICIAIWPMAEPRKNSTYFL
jgi:hypothetical protein